jgi:hypothetical protein
MSYPDLIEEGGRYWVTETQKNVGRVHALDATMLEGLFGQFVNRTAAQAGLVLDLPQTIPKPASVPMPRLPAFHQRDNSRPDYGGKDLRAGFSLDLWLQLEVLDAGQVLIDTRTETGQGLCLATAGNGTLRLTLHDGRQECAWASDPALLQAGRLHHVTVIVDGGP